MALCSWSSSRIIVALFFLLLAYWAMKMYNNFVTASCTDPNRCLRPAYPMKQRMQLLIYTSMHSSFKRNKNLNLLFNETAFQRNDTLNIDINVTLPHSTLQNGSLYVHVLLGPHGRDLTLPSLRDHITIINVPVTRHKIPSATKFNLVTGDYESLADNSSALPVTHWIPRLSFYGVGEDWSFDSMLLPPDLWFAKTLKLIPGAMKYIPIMYCNELHVLDRHLLRVTSDNTTMPLTITYSTVGLMQLRVWIQFKQSLKAMSTLGFSDKDVDTLKELIFGNNLYLLGLTFLISFFHVLFDFLAFKNDVNFWRKRKTIIGVSKRTVIWKCFSYTVVFLYLMEEETSLLVLVPAGIAAVIEYWKTWKALKLQINWSSGLPKFTFQEQLVKEKETESYDSQAMKYLSYVLFPLVILGAIYCLLYLSYKSWYSWLIHSLVNGVYAFGFLFMLPQLFVNYKLKSVAHLPLRAFMYKAFNTFIDDVFAFIITMPTSHRVAVFRDDLVFLIYLYQRWLYPVDKSRVNEFGESFDTDKDSVKKNK